MGAEMEKLGPLREEANRLGRDRFVLRHAGFYLLKKPSVKKAAPRDEAPAAVMDYQTTGYRLKPNPDAETIPFASEWRIIAVGKRAGNPFPERIGVGRAPNCDIVLRFPFVSKLHAHFLVVNDAPRSLVDLKSANKTMVNGRALVPHEPADLRAGDVLTFGALDVHYIEAARLYDLLLTEAASD